MHSSWELVHYWGSPGWVGCWTSPRMCCMARTMTSEDQAAVFWKVTWVARRMELSYCSISMPYRTISQSFILSGCVFLQLANSKDNYPHVFKYIKPKWRCPRAFCGTFCNTWTLAISQLFFLQTQSKWSLQSGLLLTASYHLPWTEPFVAETSQKQKDPVFLQVTPSPQPPFPPTVINPNCPARVLPQLLKSIVCALSDPLVNTWQNQCDFHTRGQRTLK